jgi:hypothetical protein
MKGKKTGGRQKGTPNKRSRKFLQSREQAAAVLEGVIPNAFKGDAHTYLMAIYKDPTVDQAIRLDAAKAAAPYEKPKLASTEFKGDPDSQVQHKLQIEFVRSPHSED